MFTRHTKRIAAAFPPPAQDDLQDSSGVATGEKKRDIPKDHPYNPQALKPLAQALWASSVSLGHALTAYRHISRLKSATISPDGKLGGRGFIMEIQELRQKLFAACEALSTVTDTLHDEISGPHWKPRLAELDEEDADEVDRFVSESEGILEDPEKDAEEDEEKVSKEDNKGEGEKASGLPSGGTIETDTAKAPSESSGASDSMTKKASVAAYRYDRFADSSLPVDTLPGGPRVVHLDRGSDPNPSDAYTDDDWGMPGEREYDYTSEWDNNVTKESESGTPTDDTPTEAWDFGLGYGARGEGAGGYANPSGEGNGTKGVYGPSSGLPGAPAQSSGDTLDRDRLSGGMLPGDTDRPVARSDYYLGDRGDLVNTISQSELPADPPSYARNDPGLPNTDYVTEDMDTPYVRYDYNTPNYREDPLFNWPEKRNQ